MSSFEMKCNLCGWYIVSEKIVRSCVKCGSSMKIRGASSSADKDDYRTRLDELDERIFELELEVEDFRNKYQNLLRSYRQIETILVRQQMKKSQEAPN